MISDSLRAIADTLAGFAVNNCPVEPALAAAIARELMDHARTAEILETLPFDVTTAILELPK